MTALFLKKDILPVMKLEKIKLSGFKSFVDATTIPIKGNLVSIVGPNGCGKSNIIDAVRWVMGESSAKHLRGGSMADVISMALQGVNLLVLRRLSWFLITPKALQVVSLPNTVPLP